MNKKFTVTIIIFILIIALFATIQILILNEINEKSGLSFTDEDVIITVNSTIGHVYARYGLYNYGELTSYWILLPFASRPWDINLTLDGIPLDYSWTISDVPPEIEKFDTISFKVEVPVGEQSNILVSYYRNYELKEENSEQTIVFRYIVGSTRSWFEPLNFAHFEFWFLENEVKTIIDSRDFYNWMPEETFLYFEYQL